MFETRLPSRPGPRCTLPALFLLLTVAWTTNATAENTDGSAPAKDESAIEDISIEELLNTQLTRRAAMGIHHTHQKGEWMATYHFHFMSMDGNRSGSNNLSDDEVLADFPVAPTNMEMQMHMFGLMYAPLDDLTVMAMGSYVSKSMDHVTRMGGNFETNSAGISDLKASALYTFLDLGEHRVHVSAGMSFPIGTVNARDDLPIGDDLRLPYPMQIGSGTFDLLPGLTYLGLAGPTSFGAHIDGVIRLGENKNDYRLGHVLNGAAWFTYEASEWFGATAMLTTKIAGDVKGADPELNPMMVPTADPELRGMESLDGSLGAYLFVPRGPLEGLRVSVQGGAPLFQSLDGPQLRSRFELKSLVQYLWTL